MKRMCCSRERDVCADREKNVAINTQIGFSIRISVVVPSENRPRVRTEIYVRLSKLNV